MSKWLKMPFGGDYSPEQWSEEVFNRDIESFQLAGIDMVTINVFSWAKNQPDENTYELEWLDEVMDKYAARGIDVCLATGTAAHPAWMAKKYPDVLSVDFSGRKRKFGARHNSCPNSPTYRKFARRMAETLAHRYRSHPALKIWHINNEYGCQCYCDNCEKAFRIWLQKKYKTIENLNFSWYTDFWGHTFYDWDEIVLPNVLSEHLFDHKPEVTFAPAITIDYYRFNSDSVLDCYLDEYMAIKRITPDILTTSNLHGHATYMPLDYFKWAKHMDIVAWDNYPSLKTPKSVVAFRHDLMRGLKGNKPYLIMEQSPNQQNWQKYNYLKRPGVMRLQSYQAIAHGADSILFFQLRRSLGGCEKLHGAVIDHVDYRNTRVFKESTVLGKELQLLGDNLIDSLPVNRVGILFDWENWWGVEFCSGPSAELDYVEEVQKYYNAFYEQNISVDIIGCDADLEKYEVVVAPVLYMIKAGYSDRLKEFVSNGGTFLTTFFSGIANENDQITTRGYPGELRELLGVWVEEIDALYPEQKNQIVMKEPYYFTKEEYECANFCDLLHAEGAEVLAEYGSDFYKGMPVLTCNDFGKGKAWYIATNPEPLFLKELAERICSEKRIEKILDAPSGMEVTQRVKEGKTFTFILNHENHINTVNIGEEQQKELLSGVNLVGKVNVEPKDVLILAKN